VSRAEADAFDEKHLAQLVGRTVIGLAMDNSDPYGTVWALRLSGGKIAWIQQDPEGNGPGHLSIEDEAATAVVIPKPEPPKKKKGAR